MNKKDIAIAELKSIAYKAREALANVLDSVAKLPEPYPDGVRAMLSAIERDCGTAVEDSKALLKGIKPEQRGRPPNEHRLLPPGRKLT